MLSNQQEINNEEKIQNLDIEEGMEKDICENLEEALNDIQLPAIEAEPLAPNERLQKMLEEVGDYSLETATDASLASLTWQDFPAL